MPSDLEGPRNFCHAIWIALCSFAVGVGAVYLIWWVQQ